MTKSKQQIIIEIQEYIRRWGGSYTQWYVGVTEDPEERLFNEHKLTRNNDTWIYREAENSNSAREIEKHFIDVLGTDGGGGGGDSDARFIYAYKKSSHTNP